jgi:hypothetical protein
MQRILLAALLLLLVPASSFAARTPSSFGAGRSFVIASSSPGNAYAAGVSVVTTAPVAGDLSAAGGSIIVAAPVAGDTLLFAGSINSRAPLRGDLRSFGGSAVIEGSIAGDLFAFGFSVRDSGRPAGSVFIIAADAAVTNGSVGPVTIYGNNISLAGNFADNVTLVSSGHVTLAASTTIQGKLSYQAPEPALVPASATIRGGVEYINASYLPDPGTSRTLALVSIGFFLFVRILGALILAGLLAGLFPRLAEAIAERAYTKRPRSILLTMLLGFAILVATPVLLVMLSLTFVGIGLAFLLLVLYALLALLAVMYAGILLGSLFARRFRERDIVLWHDGVLGMLALSFIAFVPAIGLFVAFLLTVFSAGALLQLFFSFAFPHEEQTSQMV